VNSTTFWQSIQTAVGLPSRLRWSTVSETKSGQVWAELNIIYSRFSLDHLSKNRPPCGDNRNLPHESWLWIIVTQQLWEMSLMKAIDQCLSACSEWLLMVLYWEPVEGSISWQRLYPFSSGETLAPRSGEKHLSSTHIILLSRIKHFKWQWFCISYSLLLSLAMVKKKSLENHTQAVTHTHTHTHTPTHTSLQSMWYHQLWLHFVHIQTQ